MYIRLTVVAFRIGNLFAFQPETLVNDKTAKLKAYQKRWKAKKEERLCLFSKRFRKVFGKGIVLNKHRFKCSEGFFVFFFSSRRFYRCCSIPIRIFQPACSLNVFERLTLNTSRTCLLMYMERHVFIYSKRIF